MSPATTSLLVLFAGMIALAGCIPATIAYNKGHSFLYWWLCGVLLLPVAFVWSITMPAAPDWLPPGRVACPNCAEAIRKKAQVCPFCRLDTRMRWAQPFDTRAPGALGNQDPSIETTVNASVPTPMPAAPWDCPPDSDGSERSYGD